MINAYIQNIYLASVMFTIGWVLMKKVAYYVYIEDYKGFAFTKVPYYWLEVIYVLVWVELTPVHTYNEALSVILVCMVVKMIMDKLVIIDNVIIKYLKKKPLE